jgi:hypothetical protein
MTNTGLHVQGTPLPLRVGTILDVHVLGRKVGTLFRDLDEYVFQ